jgi:hypothetical protein
MRPKSASNKKTDEEKVGDEEIEKEESKTILMRW